MAMDNDKKPIIEEEELSFSIEKYHPNVASSSTQHPLLDLNIACRGSDQLTLSDLDEDILDSDKIEDIEGDTNQVPVPEISVSATQATVSTLASIANGQSSRMRQVFSPDMLAEPMINNPKKAKRIITNRISPMRTKEKRKIHMQTLGKELQKLRSESTDLSSRLGLVEEQQHHLDEENTTLKERTANIVRQIQLQNSLNKEIGREIRLFKLLAAQVFGNGGSMINIGAPSGSKNPSVPFPLRNIQGQRRLHELHQFIHSGRHPFLFQFQQRGSNQCQYPVHNVQRWPHYWK